MFGYSSRQIKYNVQTKQFEYISVLGLPLHINRFTRNRLPNQISLLPQCSILVSISACDDDSDALSNRISNQIA